MAFTDGLLSARVHHTARMAGDSLRRIAVLLAERNEIDDQIAEIIGRPMTSGHLGEWIAAQIFDIQLFSSATTEAIDGHFSSGPLKDRGVNVKWYLQQEGLLDMTMSQQPYDYLVMAGPTRPAGTSAGQSRPWQIDSVYLFDAQALRADLSSHGRRVGTASSIRQDVWAAAEIYPNRRNTRLPLTDDQMEMLRLFAPRE